MSSHIYTLDVLHMRINQNPDALLASGAAAGVAAGFNAPIAGIFFASEVVRPADDNSLDLTTRRAI